MLPGAVPGEGQYAAVLRKHGTPEHLRGANPFSLFRAEVPAPEAARPPLELDRERPSATFTETPGAAARGSRRPAHPLLPGPTAGTGQKPGETLQQPLSQSQTN